MQQHVLITSSITFKKKKMCLGWFTDLYAFPFIISTPLSLHLPIYPPFSVPSVQPTDIYSWETFKCPHLPIYRRHYVKLKRISHKLGFCMHVCIYLLGTELMCTGHEVCTKQRETDWVAALGGKLQALLKHLLKCTAVEATHKNREKRKIYIFKLMSELCTGLTRVSHECLTRK